MNKIEEKYRGEYYNVFDYLKHLTILSSGYILVMSAILEKLFQQPEWKLLIVVSFGAFLFSIFFSVIAQAYHFEYIHTSEELPEDFAPRVVLLAWVSFIIGALSLMVFTLKNYL